MGSNLNSFGNEGQPGLFQDGKKLYFTSSKSENKEDLLPRTSVISAAEFETEFETIFNGNPNIWDVDISQINNLLKK